MHFIGAAALQLLITALLCDQLQYETALTLALKKNES